MSTKKIDWQKAANDAAEFVSSVLSEAHREVLPWHGPTNTWLAFDTRCPFDPQGYLEMLCEWHLEDYGLEVRGSAVSEDESSLAVLFTFDPDGPHRSNQETATELLWRIWRLETDMEIDALPKAEQKDQRSLRELQEAIERKTAADRVKRYVMDRPSDWDRELEKAYQADKSRK